MDDRIGKPKSQGRTYIGIHYTCCNVYTRVYLNPSQTAYTGHCPKCAAPVNIQIAAGGSPSRFWSAD